MSQSTAKVGAIVVAAGGSLRMAGVDKIFAPLKGRPLISYSLEALQSAPEIHEIVLVTSSRNIGECLRLVQESGWTKVKEVCEGGERRRDSVREGLNRLPDSSWIVVHDGARPLVTDELVSRALAAARTTGAAVAGMPVSDTIKLVDEGGLVKETLRRDDLRAIQTPQAFERRLLAEAHESLSEDFTDDAAMVERMGADVRVCEGSFRNIKVTTQADLRLAEALLDMREPPAHAPQR